MKKPLILSFMGLACLVNGCTSSYRIVEPSAISSPQANEEWKEPPLLQLNKTAEQVHVQWTE